MPKTNDWTLITKTENYYYWRHRDGYYQCTKGSVPVSSAGYYNLSELQKLKNDYSPSRKEAEHPKKKTYSIQWVAEVIGESEIEADNLEEARILAGETDKSTIDFYPLEDVSDAQITCVVNIEDEEDSWNTWESTDDEITNKIKELQDRLTKLESMMLSDLEELESTALSGLVGTRETEKGTEVRMLFSFVTGSVLPIGSVRSCHELLVGNILKLCETYSNTFVRVRDVENTYCAVYDITDIESGTLLNDIGFKRADTVIEIWQFYTPETNKETAGTYSETLKAAQAQARSHPLPCDREREQKR